MTTAFTGQSDVTSPATTQAGDIIQRLRLTLALQHWSGSGATLYSAGHGVFLALLRFGDTQLAQRMHDGQCRHPFALSPIRVTPAGGGLARAELVCSMWSGDVTSALIAGASQALNATLDVAGHPASILNIEVLERTSFSRLFAAPDQMLPARAIPGAQQLADDGIWVHFTTPTFFSFGRGLNGRHQYGLLPTVEYVLGSWLRAWGNMEPAPHPFENKSEWLRENVRVLGVRGLETVTVLGGKVPLTGFVGEVAFGWCGSKPGGQAGLRALIRFSSYCGTGAKTAMGFGQTEPATQL